MEILEASTSNLSFQMRKGEAIFQEQDFILVKEEYEDEEKQFIAQISRLTQTERDIIKGYATILGEIDPDTFSLHTCRFPISITAKLFHPPPGLISKVFSFRGEDGIYLGDVITSENNADSFLISPEFMERHVLCVASTGAGKSYTVGVILEELLLKTQGVAIVLFDIHNEYWGLIEPNEGPELRKLSYNSHKPRGFINNVMVFNKQVLSLGEKFDLSRLRRILDLTPAQENSLVNIIQEPVKIQELIPLIESVDMHSSTRENLISKINALINLELFKDRLEIEALSTPSQISIIRLDEFVDERKRDLVVNEILNHLFEKKFRGELPRENDIVIVVEEAHRYAKSSEILARIAREGRKFGIYEILISQRPGDLPDNIIANMNTLIALRIRSDKDINKIRMMEGISSDTVSILPHLEKGEALLVGQHGATNLPLKINIRPRLTKHIDPQKDVMPPNTPFFHHKHDLKVTIEDFSIEASEIEDVTIHGQMPIKLELFNYKDLTNLLSCQHILIQHKFTGICLYDCGTTMLRIDAQLVSGFLTAISGLFSELKSKKPVKDRTIIRMFTEEIGDRAFEILTVEGSYSILAIILDRKPKYLARFKRKVRNFIYAFENRYKSTLEDFVGVLDEFQTTYEFLDQHLGLALQTPLLMNPNYSGAHPYPLVSNIITALSEQLAISEGIFLEEIVSHCLLDTEYNYREITEILILMLEEKILVLADPKRQLPPIQSKNEVEFKDSVETGVSVPENTEITDELDQDVFSEPLDLEKEETMVKDLLAECQVRTLPDSLKKDILERDFIFESSIKIKPKTIRLETLGIDELRKWVIKILEKGFKLDKILNNPLKGKKLIFRSDFGSTAISIALLSEHEVLVIFGEIG